MRVEAEMAIELVSEFQQHRNFDQQYFWITLINIPCPIGIQRRDFLPSKHSVKVKKNNNN